MNINLNRKKCLKYLYGSTKTFIPYLIVTILMYSAEVLTLFIIKDFINKIISLNINITAYVITFVVSTVLTIIFMVLKNNFKSKLSFNIRNKMINDAYSSLLEADINELKREEVKKASDNIISNCNFIANNYINNEVLDLYELIIGIIILSFSGLFVQTILTLALVISLMFYYLSTMTVLFALKRASTKEQKLNEENSKYITDTFIEVRDIKLKNGIDLEKNIFNKKLENTNKNYLRKSFAELLSNKIVNIAYICILVSITLGLGGLFYIDDSYSLSLGDLIYFVSISPIVYNLMYNVLHCKVRLSYIDKQNEELNIIYSLHQEGKSEPISALEEVKSISFKNVYFNLENKEIISNMSFDLEKNEKIGILCESKEVRDVIYNILTKLYKTKSGIVEINGCELNKIRTSYLRSIITSIDCETNVFNKTIKENIVFPDEFDEYKYNDALNKTGLKELIGYIPNTDKTIIDEKFIENHKDIMTRIIFANAFYKDSKVFLLNDVSSNLDFETERLMFDEINKLKNKMIINITNKVYLLSNYDKILIIEDGKQVEYGKYDDLMYDKSSLLYKTVKNVKINK